MRRPLAALDRGTARRVYDRIGARQDSQWFYEDPATDRLLEHGRFDEARTVVELGCGTGRFAETLLEHHLPEPAVYRGYDLSPEMVRLARRRLARFGDRAGVVRTDGDPGLDDASEPCDRFVSNYVLDLLSEDDARAALAGAARRLVPGGLLCLAGLTPGFTWRSRFLMAVWRSVYRLSPKRLGGCRPVALDGLLDPSCWEIVHHDRVDPWGIPSAALVARRRVGALPEA